MVELLVVLLIFVVLHSCIAAHCGADCSISGHWGADYKIVFPWSHGGASGSIAGYGGAAGSIVGDGGAAGSIAGHGGAAGSIVGHGGAAVSITDCSIAGGHYGGDCSITGLCDKTEQISTHLKVEEHKLGNDKRKLISNTGQRPDSFNAFLQNDIDNVERFPKSNT